MALRDAIVLVPFAQHLPLARRAWAALGGWPPRIETTLTLARSVAPPAATEPSQISFDRAVDRLTARRLLASRPWGEAWQRRDRRGFGHAVNAVVQSAQAFARAAASTSPLQRAAYWSRGRDMLSAAGAGPGGAERVLARVAFEWAAVGGNPPTDVLFEIRPAAWIVVQAGGADKVATALMSHAGDVPALLIDTDALADAPFEQIPESWQATLSVCPDFEAEAKRTAAQVLSLLNGGHRPVALIAQDRLLIRRVRALLGRQRVPMLDETGWKLSTTRAGATIMALLRAADARATADDWLDWLKSCAPAWPGRADAARSVQVVEAVMRRKGWNLPSAVDPSHLAKGAAALWQSAQQAVSLLGGAPRRRTFSAWRNALVAALQACGGWALLREDDAGRQALSALHLHDSIFEAGDQDHDAVSFDDFTAWVDEALEDESFIPKAPQSAIDAAVVITPLARAMLRPFAAAVLPGADEKRLGAAPAPQALLDDALAGELGLPTSVEQRHGETRAFAQLLRVPQLHLLRRLDDAGEPLSPSPLLERLRLSMLRAGRGDLPQPLTSMLRRSTVARPVARPSPQAPDLLPERLSASACEALRACPYRFFALRMLSLREADELDDAVEKRDYGTWLHAVLHRFHEQRVAPLPAADEEAHLHATAEDVRHRMGLDDAAFLPYAATFIRFAPRYVAWLHARDRAGARWLDGERELKARPPQWQGIEMHGVIDRVDSAPGADGEITQLIDYKTGSAQVLRQQVRQPQEDTQLAFYAALMAQQSEAAGDIAAMYLPLDESEGIRPIEHPDVLDTAALLIEGIGRDLAHVREGSGMPALGEGPACDFCDARGLCRRDDWAPPALPT